jgi:hypothetical protein
MKNERPLITFKFLIAFRVIHELQLNALISPVIQKWNVIVHYLTRGTTQKIGIQKICSASIHMYTSPCHILNLYLINCASWYLCLVLIHLATMYQKSCAHLFNIFAVIKNILCFIRNIFCHLYGKLYLKLN